MKLTLQMLWLGMMFTVISAAFGASTNSTWSVQSWQLDDGLPNNTVTGLAQTPDGYLWIATPSRLARFDGVSFESFPFSKIHAGAAGGSLSLLCALDGAVWVGMSQGSLVRLQAGQVRVFSNDTPRLYPQTLTEGPEGSIWITYVRGTACRIEKGKVTQFTTADGWPMASVASFARDNQDQLWWAKAGQLGVFREGRFVPLLRLPRPNARLAAARDGGVWVCSGPQLFHYREGGVLTDYGRSDATLDPTVALEDRQGAVWIGTSARGLFRVKGGVFESVPTSHREIRALLEDRVGNIWVGTDGAGLNRVRPRAVAFEDQAAGLPFETIRSICEDANGVVWAVTRNGLLVTRDQSGWRNVSSDPAWSGGAATCVASDPEGGIWIGMQARELRHWRDGRFTRFGSSDGLRGRTTHGLLVDRNGDLWIGQSSSNSLQRLRNAQFFNFKLPPGIGLIQAMAEDSAGNVWVGTLGGLLLRASGDELTDATSVIPGPSAAIHALHAAADGSLWIGFGEGGLGRLKQGKFVRIGTEQGLYNNSISQIVADGRGWVWFGSGQGVFKVREAELDDVADGRAEGVRSIRYGRDEGLESLQANFGYYPAAMRSRDGQLWLPMTRGLVVVNPAADRVDTEPPPMALRRVAMDDRTVAWYGGVLPAGGVVDLGSSDPKLRLPPTFRRLDLDFAALSFVAPDNVHFRCRLEGFDDGWVDIGTRRSVTYPRLSAGTYRFHLKACNSDGVWNERGLMLAFTVEPFFWQRWSFRFAVLAAFTLGLILLVRYVSFRRLRSRLQILEQQAVVEKERTRIARDLHDDLGGSLTQVSLLLEMSQGKPPASDPFRHVRECSSIMRQVVKSVDEIIWAINPRNDTVRYLVDYMSQFAVEFLHAAGIPCRVVLPDILPERAVSPEVRHNMFLVVKEALNNIARHAQAKQVKLSVALSDEAIAVTIEDDGKGFEGSPDNATADGLRNMRQRMEEIGGEFRIESKPGAGTTIVFRYPWH